MKLGLVAACCLAVVPGAEAASGADDCVAIAATDDARLMVDGKDVPVGREGMPLEHCGKARFSSPVVILKFLPGEGDLLSKSYRSSADDTGALVAERITIGVSILELIRRGQQGNRPSTAGTYVASKAGLISFQKVGGRDVVAMADPYDLFAKSNPDSSKVSLFAPEKASQPALRLVASGCDVSAELKIDCGQKGPRSYRKKWAFFAYDFTDKLEIGKTYTLTSAAQKEPVPVTVVPNDFLKDYYRVASKGKFGQVRYIDGLGPAERFDFLLTQLSFNLLVNNEEGASTTIEDIRRRFPNLYK